MATMYIGDFMYSYPNDWDSVLTTAFVGEMNDKIMELMQRHYEFYGEFLEEDRYVTSGSTLFCSAGSTESLFDLPVDHAVERSDGTRIGICTDCKSGSNIICFGYCDKPTPDGYPRRSTAPGEKEKCIPMLGKRWHPGKKDDLRIYDQTQGIYSVALTSGAFLTCFYGGVIRVAKVYAGDDKLQAIDRIDAISECSDEQINTIKYVIKVLLMDGYKRNFVSAVAGNIIAECGQAGHFEGAAYGSNDNPKPKKSYLSHMVKYHQYRPDDWETERTLSGAEKVSDQNIYDLGSGTGIFSKQLGWDSENKRFACDVCDACGGGDGDHICKYHKFGFGMCQWTDNGIDKNGNVVATGRLPLLIIKYLEEFGENAKPDWQECCRVETDYLCQELQYSQYSKIAGIHKEDCTLEDATRDFLSIFEVPGDWEDKLGDRLRYAQNVLDAIMEVWDEES